MARLGANINATDLQLLINKVEANGPKTNRSELWSLVEALPEALVCKPVSLTASRAYILSKQYSGLTILTPLGKKGKQKGSGPVPNSGKKSRVIPLTVLNEVKKYTPPKFVGVYDRFAKGGMKAAIRMKCHECCNWDRNEIKFCQIKSCGLWMFRPYGDKKG